MTYPIVPVFPAGYAPVPADFDNWIQEPFEWLTSKPVFRAEYHGTLSLPATTRTTIPYDTIGDDPYSGWNATSHYWTPPPQGSGWYEISTTAFATNPGSATQQLVAAVYLNGALYFQSTCWGATGHACGTTMAVIAYLTAGTQVQGNIYSQVTTSTTATAGQYPTMEIVWLST